MRVAIESFRGEAPRITPRELPENAAQAAVNARLQSGDLESWRQFALTHALAHSRDVQTIYLLNDAWLSWEADVDVARGAIPGDNTFRAYLTGPDVYDQPRFTNYALATTGAEPFPVTTRPLGVPAPDSQPTLEAGVSTAPNSTTTEVVDSGDQLNEAWSFSAPVSTAFTRSIVSEDSLDGNGPPSYSLQYAENVNQPAYQLRDFGVADSQVVEFSCDVEFNTASRKRMFIEVLASISGAGIGVVWTEAGNLEIGIMAGATAQGFSALAGVGVGAPSANVFYTVSVLAITNANNTRTVTATLYLGSVQLGTVTVTNAFVNNGGYFGFVAEISEPTSPDPIIHYDNILVRGTSPTTPLQQTATSYVYTFVNDLGEESAPSPPSATILKDDGTAITVTTATSVPSGFSVDYGVTHKRIYRATSGATGTVFLFVAEIPLSQAEYVDELTDSELGDPLETELYALPPDDLRGILALPNGIMAGFRRNQICFSVQNRPHAWPVEWRLNTDTDVVGIGNIDTTLVIGTKAFPYLAIGNDPSAYSMTKLEKKQACVSKRSVAYLTGIGVVFASPDGLVAVSGNGSVRNLTETIFTRRQWQAISPETIVGVEHDDVYHFFSGLSPTFDEVQVFEADGTWMKPPGLVSIDVAGLGAGGGGGGGAHSGGSANPAGGGAGGGGARKTVTILAGDLGDTEAVVIGIGGVGGVGGASGSGTAGATGGNTSFGAHLTAYGGGGGDGGHNNVVAGGGGGGGGANAAGTVGTPAGSGGLGGSPDGGDGGGLSTAGESTTTAGAGGGGGSFPPTTAGSSTSGGPGGGGGGSSNSSASNGGFAGGDGGTSELVTTPATGGAINLPGADGEDPDDLTEGKAGSAGAGGGGSGSNVAGFNTGLAGDGGDGGKAAGGGGGGAVYATLSAHTGDGGDGGDGLIVVTASGDTVESIGRFGYALDMKETGFGLITLGYHAAAVHSDPLTDNLYLVLTEDEEPTGPSGTLLGSTAPLVTQPFATIYQFDADDEVTAMTYLHKGKLNLLPRPAAFTFCQVKAADYDNLVMNLYADGVLFFTTQIVDKEPFTLPLTDDYEEFEFEFVGTSRLRTAQFVEDIRELT